MKIAGKDRCINCMQPLNRSGACLHCSFDEKNYMTGIGELKPGTCLNERYFIGRRLGRGGFGITYIAWDIVLTMKVAVKEYFPENNAVRNTEKNGEYLTEIKLASGGDSDAYAKGLNEFLREARTLSKFASLEGVVTVRDFFRENNTAYLVMEYVNGIRVSDHIKHNGPMSASAALGKLEPLIASLAVIHNTGYIHKDISANNIILTHSGKLVLIDFGAARSIEQSELTMTVAVKRGFSPEEQYRIKGKIGPWSDIYSLCTTIYYMVTGIIPAEAVERVLADNVTPLADMTEVDISPDIKRAIDKGMAVLAENRYRNVEELYQVLYPHGSLPDISILDIVNDVGEADDLQPGNDRSGRTISKTGLRRELDRLFAREKKYHRIKSFRNAAIAILFIITLIAVIRHYGNSDASVDQKDNTVANDVEIIENEPEFMTVPDVAGRNYDTVKEELAQAGFSVSKESVESDKPKGTIMDQSIAPSVKVAVGTGIILTVSKGMESTSGTDHKTDNKTKPTATPKTDNKTKPTATPRTDNKTKPTVTPKPDNKTKPIDTLKPNKKTGSASVPKPDNNDDAIGSLD